MSASEIVNKVWNYAHVLRDDGVGYGDYVEQITFLIFLKMADERESSGQTVAVPEEYNWSNLVKLDGDALEIQYRHTLEELGKQSGMLGTIFRKAQNKIQDPAKLERLIKMIEKEAWSTLPVDVKGEIYEGLLERNAQDVKGGAGQYFTPRPLIEAMVEVMQPDITKLHTVADPACGTGGFLLAAYDYMAPNASSKKEQKHLREDALKGNDIVDSVTRLCAMNLYLHGIGSADGDSPVVSNDALAKEVSDKDLVDMVLANPPFGKKSSITIINEKTGKAESEKLTYEREDFWATTSNKQLNFVQHITNMLKIEGKAAVVVPDNVLFEGGAGETIRKNLLTRCNLHTLLRLPTGIFYAQGVKANVIFFDNKPAAKEPWTKELWVYDYRTNVHKTLKQNRLNKNDFKEFIDLYCADDIKKRKATWNEETGEGRWRNYSYDEIISRDKTNLDIFWLKDDSLEDTENLPAPDILASEIVEQLEAALEEFRSVEEILNCENENENENETETANENKYIKPIFERSAAFIDSKEKTSCLIISLDDLNGNGFEANYSKLHKLFVKEKVPVTYFPTVADSDKVLKKMKVDVNYQVGWHGDKPHLMDENPTKNIDAKINTSLIAHPYGKIDPKIDKDGDFYIGRGVYGAPNDFDNLDIKNLNSFSLGKKRLTDPYPGSSTSSPMKVIQNAFKDGNKLVSIHIHNDDGYINAQKVISTAKKFNVRIIFQADIPTVLEEYDEK